MKNIFLNLIAAFWFLAPIIVSGQNPNIKCYFNHPVNTSVSSGVNANYNNAFKDTLIGYINRSKYTLDFCVYNYSYYSGDGLNAIATAVNNAYSRGVVIRWIYNGSSSNSGLALLNTNIKTLASPTGSGYGICHNKFVVIDANSANAADAFVWTGSFNFSQQQNDADYNNVIIFQDKPFAQTFLSQFNQMWGGVGSTPNLILSKFGTYKTPNASSNFTINGTPVQVYFSPTDNATSQLQNAISTANYELFFGIYTFTDNNVATAIKNKILSGVMSKGIEDSFSQSYTPYNTLSPTMNTNLKVYTGSAIYHNKMLLVDPLHPSSDPIICTGSYNWSSSGTNSNDENMVVVHDAIVSNQYYQSFCKNFVDVGGTACASLTGIYSYDYDHQNIAVYPTITNDEINIQLKTAEPEFKVNLYDSMSELIISNTYSTSNIITINLKLLDAGYYYVKIFNGVEISAHKIIKVD